METTTLCICTNIPKELENDCFKVGSIYRQCDGWEGKDWQMTNGVQMAPELFNPNFISLAPVMLDLFKKMGMVKEDGSPLSKAAFKKLADIHRYGTKLKIFYFYAGSPKDRLIAFYPPSSNLKDQTQESYEMYMDIIKGDMEPIDDKVVQIGNCGIQFTYTDIYFKWDKTILDILEDEPNEDFFL